MLEGSVRLDGNQLRITAQLIDAHDDNHLWAQNYDREVDEIFDIQEEIAALVVRELEVPLLGELPHIQRTDPEAYSLYLQSKVEVATMEAIDESIDKLKQALAIDPAYAVAWEALGRRYLYCYLNFESCVEEHLQLARSSAEKALSLDPFYAPAYSLLGGLAWQKNELRAAARYTERALELDPGEAARAIGLLQSLGRFDEALQLTWFWLLRDPLSDGAHASHGLTLLMARRLAEAEPHWRRAISLNPEGALWKPAFLAMIMGFQGEYHEALDFLENQPENLYNQTVLSWLYQQLDMTEESERELAQVTAMLLSSGMFSLSICAGMSS